MNEFKVLPTDERFQNLTSQQFSFILLSMEQDAKEIEMARKGINPNEYFEDDNADWLNPENDLFEDIELESDEIAEQVDAITSEEDLEKAKQRFKSEEEWVEEAENGNKFAIKTHQQKILNESWQKVWDEVKMLEDKDSDTDNNDNENMIDSVDDSGFTFEDIDFSKELEEFENDKY